MTFSLLIYDPAITLLSSNTFTDLIVHKIRSTRIAAYKNMTSFTGSAKVRLWWPQETECLGTIKDP